MSNDDTAATSLVNIINKLNGPEIPMEDIDWLNEVPLCKDITETLNSHIAIGERNAGLLLSDIALDSEEYEIWQKALCAGLVSSDALPSGSVTREILETSSSYVHPTELRRHLRQAEEELALFQCEFLGLSRQIDRLQQLLQQKKVKEEKAKVVRAQTSELVKALEEELFELSGEADTVISMTTKVACQVVDLKSRKDTTNQTKNDLIILLNKLNAIYVNAVSELRHLLNRQSVETVAGLTTEADRLCHTLESLEQKHDVRAEFDRPGFTRKPDLDKPWVYQVLEGAWNVEQARVVEEKLKVLIQASSLLRKTLLPIITILAQCLAAADIEGYEILVVLQGLLDELDDIESDMDSECPCDQAPIPLDSDNLDDHLRDLLRKLQAGDLLSQGYSTNMKETCSSIVNEHATLLKEVDAISENMSNMGQKWSSKVSELSSIMLKNYETNKSEPWTMSLATQKELKVAKSHVSEATELFRKVPDDFLKSSRAHRRLNSLLQVNRP